MMKKQTPPPLLTKQVKFYCDSEMVNMINLLCSKKGLGKSELLRFLIKETFSKEIGKPEGEVKKEVREYRSTLCLTLEESKALAVKAKEANLPETKYIYSVLRYDFFKQGLMPLPELLALKAHTSEMRQIGKNLNQIARAINTEWRESEKLKHDDIKKLHEYLQGQLEYWIEQFISATNRHRRSEETEAKQ